MTDKWTPGPWYVEPDVELGYARVRAKSGTEVLYWANPADAQLAAAAPELAEALEAARHAIDILFWWLIERDPQFYPSKSGLPWAAMQDINAALSRAKGEQ